MGDFGPKYVKIRPIKDRGNHPVPRNKFNRRQENNSVSISVVDEILLYETKKVSSQKEAPEFLESDFYEDKLYQIDNMSLDETKEKL